jgi:hypothetical protein
MERTMSYLNRLGSAATVGVGPVLNPDDVNDVPLLVQAVDNPICAASRREVASQLTSQRFAYPAWVITEWAAAELPHGKGDGEVKFLLEGTASSAGEA